MKKITLYLMFLMLTIACLPNKTVSSLATINGQPVTEASQAPGTYGIQYLMDDQVVGNASGVAVSDNTFLTAGHNFQTSTMANKANILDYQGNIVTSFNPQTVKTIVDPNYKPSTGASADIGAYILPQSIDSSKLTQGTIPIANSNLAAKQKVTLVGNGISDYGTLDYNNPQRIEGAESGTLRFGQNVVAEADPYGNYYMNGQAFSTTNNGSNAVSGPGDSGGAAIVYDANGRPALGGIMQGGDMFSSGPSGMTYFDSRNNPSQISQQPNSAYGYVIGTNSHDGLYNEIISSGGQIQGYIQGQ